MREHIKRNGTEQSGTEWNGTKRNEITVTKSLEQTQSSRAEKYSQCSLTEYELIMSVAILSASALTAQG